MFAHADFSENGSHKATINLKGVGLPASDLIYQGQVISPEAALQLKRTGKVDLSFLEPDSSSNIWKNEEEATKIAVVNDNDIPVQDGDLVDFVSAPKTSSGHQKFNVQTRNGDQASPIVTLMIGVNIHNFLLKKELLRKLGYQIPGMKFLSKVRVVFSDLKQRDDFLKIQIPNNTCKTASEWEPKGTVLKDQDLEVIIQDVVAMDATPPFDNEAISPTVIMANKNYLPMSQRTLRALALPYSLTNTPESLNDFDWYAGLISNGNLVLNVDDEDSLNCKGKYDVNGQSLNDLPDFSCSLDDAFWIARKIQKLTRTDYEDIVKHSAYPEAISKLLVEKLISRRNSLLSLLKMEDHSLPIDKNITVGESIKNGKVIQIEWPGYASRFAYGDPESPFKKMKYYLFSEVESNVMENLLNIANSKIPSMTEGSDVSSHNQSVEQTLMNQYLTTGKPQELKLGVWVKPLAGGGVILSRSVVMGNYLGTYNLLQLADTFGFYVNAGFMVGVDGLVTSIPLGLQNSNLATFSFTVTHLKPLTALKQSITEPLKNEFVIWLFKKSANVFADSVGIQDSKEESKKELADLDHNFKMLDQYMGVGESLIMTKSIVGDEQVQANFGINSTPIPKIFAAVDTTQNVISRLRIYRSDINSFTVFKDSGEEFGVNVSLGLSANTFLASIPVITFTRKMNNGDAHSQVFNLNITQDPSKNPQLHATSMALDQTLRSGSTSFLESTYENSTSKVNLKFHDVSNNFQLLQHTRRRLRTDATFEIIRPGGNAFNYYFLSDGKQRGSHFQRLGGQIGTFLVQQFISKNGSGTFDTAPSSDPGTSFLGNSYTRSAQFQSRHENSMITHPYVRVDYRWEGWNITQEKVLAQVNQLNQKYGFNIYSSGFLNDTKNIRLYQLLLSLNFYEGAFKHLLSMSVDDETLLESKYKHGCLLLFCNKVAQFHRDFSQYRKLAQQQVQDQMKVAKLEFELVSDLEQFASFDDLVAAIGGADNIYISSKLDGFRMGSEELSKPLSSNSFGIPDRVYPSGPLDAAANLLNLDNGEFDMLWLREVL